MVTLQFSANRAPFSALIRLTTWSWASHVDFVLPDGRLLGATPGVGVAVRERLEPAPARVECYRAVAPDRVLELALAQAGKPYDWSGVLGLALRRDWQQPDAWFCSELVAWCFQQAGCPLLRGEYWRITPRDLLLSPHLHHSADCPQRTTAPAASR